MNNIVILKEYKKGDKLWEECPHLAFGIITMIGILIMFIALFLPMPILLDSSDLFISIWPMILLFTCIISITAISVYMNEYRNMSKSIGFIKRDNKWYAIKLGYSSDEGHATKEPISDKKSNNRQFIHAPAGSTIQALTLRNNIEVAKNVQLSEHEVRERRKQEEVYVNALNKLLVKLEKKPKEYYCKKVKYLTKFPGVYSINGVIGFLILEGPRIEKETKGYIWISYTDRHGDRTTMKFRNAYGTLVDEIRALQLRNAN